MNYSELLELVKLRLSESNRPDKGWFLITRVHLDVEKLSKVTAYFLMTGIGENRSIREADYKALAGAIHVGVNSENPGSVLRRHQLLAMVTPLRLLVKDTNRWDSVRLSERGIELAREPNKHSVLEKVLEEIVFCREPWFTPERVAEYSEFEIKPYAGILEILKASGGFIHRDEYGLFIYNLRTETEIPWAIDMIREFRELDTEHKQKLVESVRKIVIRSHRAEGEKAYDNWHDMQLHTFAVFGLGSSCVQDGHKLVLAKHYPDEPQIHGDPSAKDKIIVLKTPSAGGLDLSVPPPVQANAGSEAEQFVAKILRAQDWTVVFYTDKRGYGFDLWAKKDDVAIVIEVKSSLEIFGTLQLTEIEMTAAKHYSELFVIAIVENLKDTPKIYYVQDPCKQLALQEVTTKHFASNRTEWLPIAADLITTES